MTLASFTHSVPLCLSAKKLHLCLNKAALGNNGISSMPLLLAKAESITSFFYWFCGFDSTSSTACCVVPLDLWCPCCWHPYMVPSLYFFIFFLQKLVELMGWGGGTTTLGCAPVEELSTELLWSGKIACFTIAAVIIAGCPHGSWWPVEVNHAVYLLVLHSPTSCYGISRTWAAANSLPCIRNRLHLRYTLPCPNASPPSL